MSLKGGISATELINTIDDAKKGKQKAIDKLSKYIEDGIIPREEYAPFVMHCRIQKGKREEVRSQKIKDMLCGIASTLILFESMANVLADVFAEYGKGIAVIYLFLWLWAVSYAYSAGTKR